MLSISCGHALNATTRSISARSTTYCPALLVGGSNEIVVLSSCTGIFMNRFSGLGVKVGGVTPSWLLLAQCLRCKSVKKHSYPILAFPPSSCLSNCDDIPSRLAPRTANDHMPLPLCHGFLESCLLPMSTSAFSRSTPAYLQLWG